MAPTQGEPDMPMPDGTATLEELKARITALRDSL
jgi:hypothetical protein